MPLLRHTATLALARYSPGVELQLEASRRALCADDELGVEGVVLAERCLSLLGKDQSARVQELRVGEGEGAGVLVEGALELRVRGQRGSFDAPQGA